ncbi:MAG: RnfABCDGE type electron transport complex subunit D [Candidatus Omnitrophota bacterium]|nr:RnfABCDGE type electron transport complex subunit D [Candidatus Omnitrophota bacterium]
MKFIKNGIDSLYGIIQKNKFLIKMKPVLLAVDEFFFGTARVTDAAPHITDHMDMKRFMALVVVALMPLVMGAIYFWGWRVVAMILVSYTFGGMAEAAFAVIRKKEIHEGFLVTGLIFPLTLPPTVPLWVVAVGIVFGVIFGKEVFGGTGRNIFNPAIVGRIFLSVAFPKIMTAYWINPFKNGFGGLAAFQNSVDAVTSATPLTIFKNQVVMMSCKDLLFGQGAGSLGETFRAAIILGGIFLIVLKIVDWRIPLSYLGTVFAFPAICNHLFHTQFAPPLFQILSGGLLLGAFFMATDPVTSPFTKPGRWIAGILLGILTVLIRGLSGYVEGVMFSILLVNAFSPLIDTIVLKARYRKA